MNTRDPRYVRAEAALQKAFLELFSRDRIEAITVSQIIASAHVNRSTFYEHYRDKYDLLDSTERGFLSDLEQELRASPAARTLAGEHVDEGGLRDYYRHLVSFLLARRELVTGLTANDRNRFMVGFSKAMEHVLVSTNAVDSHSSSFHYDIVGFTWMSTGVICEWVHRDFDEEEGAFVEMLVRHGAALLLALQT